MEKEERNGCTECIRYGFVILNALFLLLGAVLITLGAWFYAIPASQNFLTIIFDEEQHRKLNTALLLILCVGGGVCFAACMSCCGAFAQSKWLLIAIFAVFGALIVAELVFIGFGANFLQLLGSGVSARMSQTLAKDYAGDHATNPESMGWREMQTYFSCCGVNTPLGYQNHTNVQYQNYTGSLWYRENKESGKLWPGSCCGVVDTGEAGSEKTCDGSTAISLNEEGCQSEAEEFISKHLLSLTVVTLVTVVCQVIAAVLCFFLFKDVATVKTKVQAAALPSASKGYDRISEVWPTP